MPRGQIDVAHLQPDDLVVRCPRKRMVLRPTAVSLFRAWLTLIGRRHVRSLDAARTAWREAGDPSQQRIIDRETAVLSTIHELMVIVEDRFGVGDWHDAVAHLHALMASVEEMGRGTPPVDR